MPVYSYKCTNCKHRFEARQRYSDEPLSTCPQCESQVRRVISQVGVVFKGNGFYVTDNRNGKANGALNGSGKNNATTSESTDSKSTAVESTSSEPTSKKETSVGATKRESGSGDTATAA